MIPEDEFIRMVETYGVEQAAIRLGLNIRGVHRRRRNLEHKLKRPIVVPKSYLSSNPYIEHPGRIEISLEAGTILVGGDCHYWPGPPSLMHRAFVQFCKEFKPAVVVLNGDVIDACAISRHPPIGWEKQPTVQEEIEAAQERVGEVEKAASRARKLWPLGNHDSRFETRLATVAPEFARVAGVHLRDHFPLWEPCWSVFINDDIVIKHRWKGGIHAPHNNTINSGRSIITGHLHSQRVSPWTDYNGTRWGVDMGCIADPDHRAFVDYTEDNSKNWRDGFVVLTIKDSRLLPPELVSRWDDKIVFRGKIMAV